MDFVPQAVSAEALEQDSTTTSLLQAIKGNIGTIQLTNRDCFEGVLSSESTTQDFLLHLPLKTERRVQHGRNVLQKLQTGEEKKSASWKHIVSIECDINPSLIKALKDFEKGGHEKTDFFSERENELPGEMGGERELKKSTWGAAPGMTLDDEDWNAGSEDQFKRNEKYGYGGSTYTDEQYTTKLKSGISKESQKRASQIEKQINSDKNAWGGDLLPFERNEDNDDSTEVRNVSKTFKKKSSTLKPVATSFQPGKKDRKLSFNQDNSPSKEQSRTVQGLGLETGRNIQPEQFNEEV